ncbi:MAG: vitamin K epoxide reductase family protein [Thermomicrobiales bacterium]
MSGGTRRLLRIAAGLAALGILLAAYLTWVHFDASSLVCGLGDCHTVQASVYASVGPAPVAVLGLGMYGLVCAANLLALARPSLLVPLSAVAFGALLAGTIYAAYLTWLEVAVIRAICQWCVASALLSLALLVIQGIITWGALGSPESGADETSGPAVAS